MDAVFIRQANLAEDCAKCYFNRGASKAELGNFAGAIEDYDRAIELRSKIIHDLGGEDALIPIQRRLANNYMNVFAKRGVAKTSLGDFAGAIDDYGRAFRIIAELIDCVNGIEAAIQNQPRLADSYSALFCNRGLAKAGLGDFADAIEDYDFAINVLLKLTRGIDRVNADIIRQAELADDCAKCFFNRGLAKAGLGNFAGAIDDYDHAIELRSNIIHDLDGDDAVIANQPRLVNKYTLIIAKRGDAKAYLGSFAEAIVDYNQAISLRFKLIQSVGGEDYVNANQPGLANDYANVIANRGVAKASQGNLEIAIVDYNQAIRLWFKLIQSVDGEDSVIANKPGLANDYANVIANRGLAKAGLADFADAINDFNHAIRLWFTLIQSVDGEDALILSQVNLTNDYAKVCCNRGFAKANRRDFDGAIEDYSLGIEQCSQLIVRLGGIDATIAIKPELVDSYARAFLLRGQGYLDGASSDLEQSVSLSQHLLPYMLQHGLQRYLQCQRSLYAFTILIGDQLKAAKIAREVVQDLIFVFREVGESISIPPVIEASHFWIELCADREIKSSIVDDKHQIALDEEFNLLL